MEKTAALLEFNAMPGRGWRAVGRTESLPVRRRGRWWARVRGTLTRTLAYLTSTVLPRRPRGDEGHGFFPRLEFLPMSRAAPLPKRGGGEAGCSSFSARALFSAVCPPAFLFFALGLHCIPSRLRVSCSDNVVDGWLRADGQGVDAGRDHRLRQVPAAPSQGKHEF